MDHFRAAEQPGQGRSEAEPVRVALRRLVCGPTRFAGWRRKVSLARYLTRHSGTQRTAYGQPRSSSCRRTGIFQSTSKSFQNRFVFRHSPCSLMWKFSTCAFWMGFPGWIRTETIFRSMRQSGKSRVDFFGPWHRIAYGLEHLSIALSSAHIWRRPKKLVLEPRARVCRGN